MPWRPFRPSRSRRSCDPCAEPFAPTQFTGGQWHCCQALRGTILSTRFQKDGDVSETPPKAGIFSTRFTARTGLERKRGSQGRSTSPPGWCPAMAETDKAEKRTDRIHRIPLILFVLSARIHNRIYGSEHLAAGLSRAPRSKDLSKFRHRSREAPKKALDYPGQPAQYEY